MESPEQRDGPASASADPEADLAGALHELSNVLTVVLGCLDSARSQLAAGEALEALEVARAHASLGHSVARRAIGAPAPGALQSRSAVALAREVASGVAHQAARRGVVVEVDDRDAADLLLHDAAAVMQILMNLLLNAVAFSPCGSRVVLRIENDGGKIAFLVQDCGPGISPDRVETIFSGRSSTRSGGSGIGLRHSRALAEAKGGELVLASSSRKGSEFRLLWPVGEAFSGTLHLAAATPLLEGRRVLVLEDDPAVLSLVELGLASRGARVAGAASAAELEQHAAAGAYDVALLDLSPIQGTAERTLSMLRRRDPTLPVVVISGTRAGAPELHGVSGWVQKPFEIPELAEVLAEVLRP